MNRRKFLLGGALVGAVAATVKVIMEGTKPPEEVELCKESHLPHESYMNLAAIAIYSPGDEKTRNLIPCKRCGVLFALPRFKQNVLTPPRPAGSIG